MEGVIKEYAQYLAMLLLYVGLEIAKAAKKWKDDRKLREKSDPGALMRKKNEIENYCHVILSETKAAHVAVWRYHNGHFYSGGDSIKFCSMYTEAAILEELHQDHKSQNWPLKNFSNTFTQLLENEFVVVQAEQAPDWHLNKSMHERRQTYKIIALLRSPDRTPIGSLVINYMNEDMNWKLVNSVMVARYRKELEYKLA